MAYIRTCVQNLGEIRRPVRNNCPSSLIIDCTRLYDIQNVNNVHLWTGRETALFIGECNQPQQNGNGHKPRKKRYIIVSVAPSICRQSHGINMVIIQLISRSNTRLRR